MCLLLALSMLPVTAMAEDTYNPGDVAAINAIITNNGLAATKDDPAGWAAADLCYLDGRFFKPCE